MGHQSTRYFYQHEDLCFGDYHDSWILVALYGSYGKLSATDGRNQHAAWLYCFGGVLGFILLFGLELSKLRDGGTKRPLQVIPKKNVFVSVTILRFEITFN